jgi:hypothetical protein
MCSYFWNLAQSKLGAKMRSALSGGQRNSVRLISETRMKIQSQPSSSFPAVALRLLGPSNMSKLRIHCLNQVIKSHFGETVNGKVESISQDYQEVRSGSYEILNVYKRTCHFVEMEKNDNNYIKVSMPKPLLTWVEKQDTFYAVFAKSEKSWKLIYLGPHLIPDSRMG